MAVKQCMKCIHQEMCKYKDQIESIKEDYSFVDDITCSKFLKEDAVSSESNTPKAKPKKAEPAKQPEPVKETKPEENESPKKDEAETYSNDDVLSIGLDKIYLSEELVRKLKFNGDMDTIKDVYDHIASSKKNLERIIGKGGVDELDRKLTSLNLPSIKKPASSES